MTRCSLPMFQFIGAIFPVNSGASSPNPDGWKIIISFSYENVAIHYKKIGIARSRVMGDLCVWSPQMYTASDSEQSEDSDAEFLVHPILRSLIKSKSAYTMKTEPPRLRTSKTAFEINLSKMWETTMDDEPPVANFTPNFDQKWPEPDAPRISMKFSTRSRKASCRSSPTIVYKGEQSASPSPMSTVLFGLK
ncbi:hypothetical protein KIN20_033583 [Parelaphostrongylus tenuis]|uniref:Uncharacterized protein n=1 Tax=Parelaphostrongylus tenuis TaxID=148309 RepID=A0AAD5WIZ4_PARTN|nr:hypothetical protein KIN20_033583 [Parelaphostrongylus tenuis]